MYTNLRKVAYVMWLLAEIARAQVDYSDAPVTLDKEVVLDVRAGYGAWTPELRAASMEKRVKEWADDPFRPDKIQIQDNETTTDLMVNDFPVVTVFDIDAKAAGVPREQLARQWAASLETAVSRYRVRYAPPQVAFRAVLAIVALVVIAFLLYVVRNAMFRLENRFCERLAIHAAQRRAGLKGMVAGGTKVGWVHSTFRSLRWLSYLVVLAAGLQFLLLISPRTRADAMQIIAAVGASLTQLGLKLWDQIPSLILVAVIAGVAYQLVQLAHLIFSKVSAGDIVLEGFRPRWASTTDRLVSIFIVVLGVLIAYPYIPGSNSPAFQGISIFIGALISLGSTGLIGNALSGIMLTYIDGYEPGDVVQIGDTTGVVTKSALLTTQVRTANQKTITLPNAVVMGSAMVNYSAVRDKGTVIPLTIGIGYDAPWRQVEWLMLQAAARTPGLNRAIDPVVLILSLNQFDVTYELDSYLQPGEPLAKVRSQLARNVLDMFNENGVQIMTPAFESNPSRTVIAPHWNPPPAAAAKPAEGQPHTTAR